MLLFYLTLALSACKYLCDVKACNRTVRIRHQYRKKTVLSCHRCLIKTGVEKMNQHLNMDYDFDHQLSLSKSKC